MDSMRDVILNQPEQITHSLEVNQDVRLNSPDIDGIILAGMGGSGHPGDLINALNLTTVPLLVHRDYGLPEIYFENPLIIISSYSGNTEEAISAYQAARAAGYQILINTSGGQLKNLAERHQNPLSLIDYPGMQPRHTLFASFTGLYLALKNSGLAKDINSDLIRVATILATQIPSLETPAQKLAAQLRDTVPIFTSSENLGFAAKNFKIQTNENAKYPAFWNTFPELNHNELIGMSQLKNLNNPNKFHVVMLLDSNDHPRVKIRMRVTSDLYKQWGATVNDFSVQGQSLLEKIFYAVTFGLWTTMFLAESYGLDPVPVAGVEDFKKKLEELAGKI